MVFSNKKGQIVHIVLVSSRSFGRFGNVGETILNAAGFTTRHIPPKEYPLNPAKLQEIVRRESPEVIISGAEPVTREVLQASGRLRLIMKHGVGVDNIDLDTASKLGIAVANVPGTNTEAVAEMAIAMMFSLLRGLCKAAESTRQGEWERFIGHELGKLTVGVIGTGKIGSEVIRRLYCMGTKVVAYDIRITDELVERYGVRYISLEELLKIADIITLHTPLTEETKGMIGAEELSKMKETAYLINCARGELVDENALYQYLSTGRIAGAALDVFSSEPPTASPLLSLDNVIPTPHIAAYTYESMNRMDKACGETIVSFFRGEKLPNVLTSAE